MRQDIDMDTNGFAFFYLQMYGTAVRFTKGSSKDSETSSIASNSSANTDVPKPQGHKDTIELLLHYKNMLDNGEITQKEFDAKKKEIL